MSLMKKPVAEFFPDGERPHRGLSAQEKAHWGLIKKKRRVLDEGKCQRCSRFWVDMHPHHLTYERYGCERIEDVISLCPRCHDAVHCAHWSSR